MFGALLLNAEVTRFTSISCGAITCTLIRVETSHLLTFTKILSPIWMYSSCKYAVFPLTAKVVIPIVYKPVTGKGHMKLRLLAYYHQLFVGTFLEKSPLKFPLGAQEMRIPGTCMS